LVYQLKKTMELRELTKAEEQIMQVLWELKKGFVKDVIDQLPEPKPAYNTVSTIIRILEKKGIISYTAYGKTHEYYPLISQEEYKSFAASQLMSGYFGNSVKNLVSFFVKEKNLKLNEADELIKLLEKFKNDQKWARYYTFWN